MFIVNLSGMLAEDSRELLGPQTVTTYQVSGAIIQEQCAFTGQVQLYFFGYQCQM